MVYTFVSGILVLPLLVFLVRYRSPPQVSRRPRRLDRREWVALAPEVDEFDGGGGEGSSRAESTKGGALDELKRGSNSGVCGVTAARRDTGEAATVGVKKVTTNKGLVSRVGLTGSGTYHTLTGC